MRLEQRTSDTWTDAELARARAERVAYRRAWARGTLPVRKTPPVVQTDGAWSVNPGPIERERVLRSWTPVHLASVAHVDPRTVRSMLAGRRRPGLRTGPALSTARGLRLP